MKFFKNKFRFKRETGPMKIIVRSEGPSKEENKFLSSAAKEIESCERTFEELERCLMEKYQAVPHTLSSNQINMLKSNVILAYFSNVLEEQEPMTLGEAVSNY